MRSSIGFTAAESPVEIPTYASLYDAGAPTIQRLNRFWLVSNMCSLTRPGAAPAYARSKPIATRILSIGVICLLSQAALPAAADESVPPARLENSIALYSERYPLSDTHAKLVSNKGDGYDHLRGMRNFRRVLNGLVYRGGANNWFRTPQRNNENPLPPEGVDHLCEEGFSTAIYSYDTNYNTPETEHVRNCTSIEGGSETKPFFCVFRVRLQVRTSQFALKRWKISFRSSTIILKVMIIDLYIYIAGMDGTPQVSLRL
jgi:hypothetical protein